MQPIHARETRILTTTLCCASCASRLPADARFCGMCGHARTPVADDDAVDALERSRTCPRRARSWMLPVFDAELLQCDAPAFTRASSREGNEPEVRARRRPRVMAWATMIGAGAVIVAALACV